MSIRVLDKNDIANINKALSSAEMIGVLSSPSNNTLLTIDLLQEAEDKNIIGNFTVIRFKQDGHDTILIGQIDSLLLRNPYLERHSIQKIISVRKDAPPLTKLHDVRIINMNIGTVYSISNVNNNYYILPVNLGSLPPTGTPVYLLNDELINNLFSQYSNELFYIGTIYNTKFLLPTIFKHFGKNERGLGEAYHIGIFGKTGSGKSVLAKMLIAAYVKHPEMSILIIDPQGEFSRELNSNSPLSQLCNEYKRCYKIYNINNISLTTFTSFEKLLKISNILKEMGIGAEENQDDAIRVIRNIISESGQRLGIHLNNCHERNIFENIINQLIQPANLRRIYRGEEYQERVRRILTDRIELDRIYNEWRRITILFSSKGRTPITSIIKDICDNRMIITLNLSETTVEDVYWNDSVLAIVLKEIIDSLTQEGNKRFINGQYLNLLVCIDEAHRFVPREKPTNEHYTELKNSLIDAIRTTRKYGLGWLFISQTLASLDNEILNQLRLYFFGYGLSWGSELRTLREIVGSKEDTYINIYQNFKDPQTAAILGEREFPFMAFGPVSLLSASGAPVFFKALNYDIEFIKANRRDSVK